MHYKFYGETTCVMAFLSLQRKMWICKLSSAYLWKYVKYFDIRDICLGVRLAPLMK